MARERNAERELPTGSGARPGTAAPIGRSRMTMLDAAAFNRQQSQGRPLGGLYVGAWGLLAAVATIYLATLALQPDLLMHERPLHGYSATSSGDRASLAQAAEVRALHQRIEQLGLDLASERATAEAMRLRLAELEAPVSVESKPAEPMPVAAAAPPPAPPGKRAAHVKLSQPLPGAPPAEATMAVKRPAIVNPAPAPIVTSSVTPPSSSGAAAAPADKPATAAPAALQLGGGPSLDSLRLSWSLLNDRHAGALKNLTPHYVGSGDGPFELLAGPVASPAEAARLCAALRARQVPCSVASFKGDAL